MRTQPVMNTCTGVTDNAQHRKWIEEEKNRVYNSQLFCIYKYYTVLVYSRLEKSAERPGNECRRSRVCFEQRLARGAVHADDASTVRAAVDHVLQRVEHERQPRDWNRSARSVWEPVEGSHQIKPEVTHITQLEAWRRDRRGTLTLCYNVYGTNNMEYGQCAITVLPLSNAVPYTMKLKSSVQTRPTQAPLTRFVIVVTWWPQKGQSICVGCGPMLNIMPASAS